MNDKNENFDMKQDETRWEKIMIKILEKKINNCLECQVLMQFYISNA